MYDPLAEIEGCDLLARLFRARGYRISRNVRFREYGVEFDIDGWDPKARVGFEYLSSEDEDHDDLSLVEYQALMDQMRRGELSLFVIDEVEPVSAADLEEKANEFLDEVATARMTRRAKKPAPKKGAKVPPKQKPAKPAAKASPKKTSAKKPAAKPVGKKKPGRRK